MIPIPTSATAVATNKLANVHPYRIPPSPDLSTAVSEYRAAVPLATGDRERAH